MGFTLDELCRQGCNGGLGETRYVTRFNFLRLRKDCQGLNP
jgi:hypothetical protein